MIAPSLGLRNLSEERNDNVSYTTLKRIGTKYHSPSQFCLENMYTTSEKQSDA